MKADNKAEQFIRGAETKRKIGVFDPDAPASRNFNLRLTEYELQLLQRVAKHEQRSGQLTARKYLREALEVIKRREGL